MTLIGATATTAVAASQPTKPETKPATTRAAEEARLLPPGQTEADLRALLLPSARRFIAPSDPKVWEMREEAIRQRILDEVILKGIPVEWQEGPTNVVWGETLPGNGYTIRKLRYEAVPGLWVGALLYEPAGISGKRPGVLNPNGHEPQGLVIAYKQERCINLVKRGMIALSTEFIGMGQLRGPAYTHNEGGHLDLCGRASVSVFYLALKRALDVLCELPSVDTERIAVTGLSGGGWQTIVISSLDTRVRLCAPNAGYTSFEERVWNPKPDLGDLEQNPADLLLTADYPELTALLYPRPALLIYNEKDDCCYPSGRTLPAVYRPTRPLYEVAGLADRFSFHVNSDPGTHNYLKDNREAFYRFINRQFLPEQERRDEEIPSADEVRTKEELAIEYPANNADFHTLAAAAAATLPLVPKPADAAELESWRSEVRKRLAAAVRPEPEMKVADSSMRLACGVDVAGGMRGFGWRLRVGGQWTIPAVEYGILSKPMPGLTLILADKGLPEARKVVPEARKASRRAVTVDLLMLGECVPAGTRPWQWPQLVSSSGRRVLGIQVSQLAAVIEWLNRTRPGEPIEIVAVGPMAGMAALATVALHPGCCEKVAVRGLPGSLKELADAGVTYEHAASVFCFGLLEAVDVPEMVELAQPTRVEVETPKQANAETSNVKTSKSQKTADK